MQNMRGKSRQISNITISKWKLLFLRLLLFRFEFFLSQFLLYEAGIQSKKAKTHFYMEKEILFSFCPIKALCSREYII